MTLVPLAILSLLFRLSLSQSELPMTIQNISFSDTIDLYNMYNDDFTFGARGTTLDWNVYNANGTTAFSTFDESLELMAGPAEEAGNDVVDIAATNLVGHSTLYALPASIPLGLYHYRINTTVNTTRFTGVSDIENITARSGTVNVTTSKPIGCGQSIPPPYYNITSPSSPLFTSLYVTEPSAGFNAYAASIQASQNATSVTWTFRDTRNSPYGTGISNVTVQVVDATTSDPVGPLQTPGKHDDWSIGMSFQVPDVPLVINGTYKLVVKYRNNFQDGLVAPGDVVTHTSEMFNFVTFDDQEDDCASRAVNATVGSDGSNGKSQPNEGRITKLSSSCLLLLCGLIVASILS